MAKGTEASGGALVVLNAKTGAVLAAATAPTYDLNLYKEDPAAVLNIENQALYNRAISGLYRPGSTFKIVTAAAALNEGVIDTDTTIVCNNTYTYWADVGFKPSCTGWHGRIDVVTALEKSCNIFFYETGRIMGIDTLAGYANSFGMGVDTGLEIRGQEGRIATPESYEKIKLDWQAGTVVMAAIGQAETNVTPLQMAVSAMTVANRGVRYEPFVVDSVYDYNMSSLISATAPEVAETIPDKTGYTFDAVIQGMIKAANFVPMTYPTENQYYTDYLLTSLPGQAAIKTGTPQMTSAEDTGSAFIGFYPADDPEIAFSCFVEHGDFSKLMIKQIIEAYYDKNYVV
jgi:penicillin-binding protein 2